MASAMLVILLIWTALTPRHLSNTERAVIWSLAVLVFAFVISYEMVFLRRDTLKREERAKSATLKIPE